MTFYRLAIIVVATLTARVASAQAPAQTFTDLQPMLKFGQQVIVFGADGRQSRGRIVAVTAGQIEIRVPRFLFREERRVFTLESARRIDYRDGTWNGGLIGAGVGAVVLAVSLGEPACNQPDDWSCAPLILSPLVGALVGSAVDGRRNRRIYQAPGQARISIAPVIRGPGAGLAASLRSSSNPPDPEL